MSDLSNSMLDLLSEFANAGIVYYERGAPYFYPTRLCTTLNAGGLSSIQQEEQQGFLVVETNYRIYAYTCIIPLYVHPVPSSQGKISITAAT